MNNKLTNEQIRQAKKELTKSDRRAITEAYRYYQLLDDECKSMIPPKFVDFLTQLKDLRLGVPLHIEIPLDMQDISEEGWGLICKMGDFFR